MKQSVVGKKSLGLPRVVRQELHYRVAAFSEPARERRQDVDVDEAERHAADPRKGKTAARSRKSADNDQWRNDRREVAGKKRWNS